MNLSECHPQRKHQARGLCKPCYDKWLKEKNPEYKQRQQANSIAWIKENKPQYHRDPENKRNTYLKTKYGITAAEYDQMLADQNGGCKLCSRKPGIRRLHTDHDHVSGKVRGLLCHQCNWFLGTVDADPSILERIKEHIA